MPRYQEAAALALALTSLLLGLVALGPVDILAGWPPGVNDGGAAMIGQSTLLAGAFVVPLGMLLACLWPRALDRMPSLLAFAPIPALVAVLLVADNSSLAIGSARLHLTFALDRPGAMLLGVAALLWIASGAYARRICRAGRTAGDSWCAG